MASPSSRDSGISYLVAPLVSVVPSGDPLTVALAAQVIEAIWELHEVVYQEALDKPHLFGDWLSQDQLKAIRRNPAGKASTYFGTFIEKEMAKRIAKDPFLSQHVEYHPSVGELALGGPDYRICGQYIFVDMTTVLEVVRHHPRHLYGEFAWYLARARSERFADMVIAAVGGMSARVEHEFRKSNQKMIDRERPVIKRELGGFPDREAHLLAFKDHWLRTDPSAPALPGPVEIKPAEVDLAKVEPAEVELAAVELAAVELVEVELRKVEIDASLLVTTLQDHETETAVLQVAPWQPGQHIWWPKKVMLAPLVVLTAMQEGYIHPDVGLPVVTPFFKGIDLRSKLKTPDQTPTIEAPDSSPEPDRQPERNHAVSQRSKAGLGMGL